MKLVVWNNLYYTHQRLLHAEEHNSIKTNNPQLLFMERKSGACLQHCVFGGSERLPFQKVFVSLVSERWWNQYVLDAWEQMRTKEGREVCLCLAPAPKDTWYSRQTLISLKDSVSGKKRYNVCPIFWFYGRPSVPNLRAEMKACQVGSHWEQRWLWICMNTYICLLESSTCDYKKTPSSCLPLGKRKSWSSHLTFLLFKGHLKGWFLFAYWKGWWYPEYSRSWSPLNCSHVLLHKTSSAADRLQREQEITVPEKRN